MTKVNRNPRGLVVDYVAKFGLLAGEISAHDHTEEGFFLVRPGANREYRHPWPDGFDYEWLCRLIRVADQNDAPTVLY